MPILHAFDPATGPRSHPRPALRHRRWPWRRPRPTFLIIGAQKSGTSWLHRMLREHPDVFVSERKELHYFSDPSVHDRGLDWYLGNFAAAGRGHRALGEATPNYLWTSDHRLDEWGDGRPEGPAFRRRIPERVHAELGGGIRLVALLRDPVERAISAFYHHLNRGGRLDPARPFEDNARRLGIVQMGFYAAHLERWLEVFDPGQLLVLVHEEVRANPRGAVESCQRHIGVRRSAPANLRDEVHTGTKHGDDRVWYWDGDRRRVAIGPDELATLREVYAPENARLVALLGRDPWPVPD